MATATTMSAGSAGYPVRYDVAYPEQLSRWMVFVKWLLAVPHYVIVYFLLVAWELVTFIAFFAILFTKKYPEGLFKFAVGVLRWRENVNAYVGLLRDEYPPFSMDPGQYPVVVDVDYPGEMSRWLIFVKWLLVIPHLIVVGLLGIVAFVLGIVAWFAILFTGKFPRAMFDFIMGVQRWNVRASAYAFLMTDKYPPFSMAP